MPLEGRDAFGGAETNHVNPHSGFRVSRTTFNPGTSEYKERILTTRLRRSLYTLDLIAPNSVDFLFSLIFDAEHVELFPNHMVLNPDDRTRH
jgi:hypothetical protein